MLGFGPFRLDVAEERLWKGNQQVALRRKPFAILGYLVAHPKRLVTHEELLEHVWNGAVVSESAVRTHLHELRQVLGEGVIETVIGRGYRFTAELASTGAPVPVTESASDRLVVGRAAELDALRGALERAKGGHRQLCFVTGEPGIGKTTLVDAFLDDADRAGALALRGHCVEQHGTPEAYLAVIEMLGKLRHDAHRDALAALVRYAPTFVSQLPHLVPEAQLPEVTRRAIGGSEARMVRELLEALEAIAAQQLVVLVFEDLQWSDLATIDLVSLLGQRRERAKLLVIATSRRAEAQTVTHPLNRVMRNLVARSGAAHVALERIAITDLRALLDQRFPGHAFPDGLATTLDRITNGTPLFVTSLLDDLEVRGMLSARDGAWQLTVSLDDLGHHRPDSVKQLIDLQLDRLTPQEQRVLEACSVVGGEFSTALVATALEQPEEQVDECLDSLTRRSLFVRRAEGEEWPDGTLQTRYAMQHGLVHEVCLERSAPARRQRWHRLIGERLEAVFGERAAEVAHVLAIHFEQGQQTLRAIHYWVVAGGRTARRFASSDAMSLFERANALVARLPASPDRDRIELRTLQGMTSMVLRGHQNQPADPLAMFERMVGLARSLDDKAALCDALFNTSIRLSTLGEYRRATAAVDEADAVAREAGLESTNQATRDTARVVAMIWQGELVPALAMLERLLPTVVFGQPSFDAVLPDRAAVNLAYLTLLHWVLGRPETALREAERAYQVATASGDPWSIGLIYCNLSRLRILTGAPVADVRDPAEQVLALPLASVWHSGAALILAWADSVENKLAPGASESMLAAFRERLRRQPIGPSHLVLTVIDALRFAGQREGAAELLAEVIAKTESCNERILASELIRLRGELAEPHDRDAAARDYREAIAVAKTMSANMLQLRAAIRLVKLESTAETRAELAAAFATFTEGFATQDLVEAKELLSSRDTTS